MLSHRALGILSLTVILIVAFTASISVIVSYGVTQLAPPSASPPPPTLASPSLPPSPAALTPSPSPPDGPSPTPSSVFGPSGSLSTLVTTDGDGFLIRDITNASTAIDLNSEVRGSLPVSMGGSGGTSFALDSMLIGNGTSGFKSTTTLPTAVQLNITQVGTIAAGVWQGTEVASDHIATILSDKLLTTSVLEDPTFTDLTTTTTGATLATVDTNGKVVLRNISASGSAIRLATEVEGTLLVSQGGTGGTSFTNGSLLIGNGTFGITSSATLPLAIQSSITQLGTITNGTWQGTEIASDAMAAILSDKLLVTSVLDDPEVTGLATGATVGSILLTIDANGKFVMRNISAGADAVSLASEVQGTLTVPHGGTGAVSLTSGSILLGGGTGPITATTTLPSATQLLITQLGTVTVGTWTASTIAVAYGGTGANSLTSGNILLGGGTGPITATTTLPAATQLLITQVGTLTAGTWTATTIAVAYGGTGANSLTSGSILLGGGTGPITATTTLPSATQLLITQLGTITSGTWTATVIASAYVDSILTGKTIVDPVVTGMTATAALGIPKRTLITYDPSEFTFVTRTLTLAGLGIDLASEVTGTLTVANGGTGAVSLTSGSILLGGGTGPITATTTLPSATQLLITQVGTITAGTWTGTAIASANIATTLSGKTFTTASLTDPTITGFATTGTVGAAMVTLSAGKFITRTFSGVNAVSLTSEIQGTLPVANGGTGAVSLTSGSILLGGGTGPITATTTLPSATQLLITQVGTVTTGTWSATTIGVTRGGTGAITTPAAGTLLIGNGATYTNAALTAGTGIAITTGSGSISIATTPLVWYLYDQKASGTAGGGTTAGATTQRDITGVTGPSADVTLASNDFTLVAGSWQIDISAPCYQCGSHDVQLFSVTAGTIQTYGTSEISGTGTQTRSIATFIVTQVSSVVYRVRHRTANTQAVNGFGFPSSAHSEIYTHIIIKKTA